MNTLEALTRCIHGLGTFTPEQVVLLHEHGRIRQVQKNEVLLEAGRVCDAAFFLLQGACYQVRPGETEDRIIDLHIPYDTVLNHSSFVQQQPSAESIRAYTACVMLELTVHNLHKLIGMSPAFFQLGKIIQASALRLSFFDNDLTPVEKYRYVLENKPELLQLFPLRYIASYLKIAPETLSRIRARY